ncbi:MAG: hypothetical protein ABI835_01740 [Chloroflexota bacterium]
MSVQIDPTRNPTSFGLALTAGAGLILMILALGFGVIQSDANGTVIGVTFAGGLLLMVVGIVAWLAMTKPFTHFDDINQPKYTGHHDEHHANAHEEAHEEQAIIPHE